MYAFFERVQLPISRKTALKFHLKISRSVKTLLLTTSDLRILKTSLSKAFLCSHRVFISSIVISILFTCLYLVEVQVPGKVSNLHFFRKVEVVQTLGLLAQETLQKVKISQILLKYLQQCLKWAVQDIQSRLQLLLVLAEHCPAVLFQ